MNGHVCQSPIVFDIKVVPIMEKITRNKTASFQKEAMRTQVALYFFLWSEICIE